jgi:hypothetical protein
MVRSPSKARRTSGTGATFYVRQVPDKHGGTGTGRVLPVRLCFQLPTKFKLFRSYRLGMKRFPEHVQDLFRLSVWELSRRLSRPKLGWIVSLRGASLEMCDWRRDFESFLNSYPVLRDCTRKIREMGQEPLAAKDWKWTH